MFISQSPGITVVVTQGSTKYRLESRLNRFNSARGHKGKKIPATEYDFSLQHGMAEEIVSQDSRTRLQ